MLDGPYLGGEYYRWLSNLANAVGTQPVTFTPVTLTNQNTSITTTNIPLPSLTQGFYQVSYYARVQVPDGVASALQITLGWTDPDGSVSTTTLGTPIALDSVTHPVSQIFPAHVKGNTPITYATTYASNTPARMHYKLDVFVQFVHA